MKIGLVSFHTFSQPGGVKNHILGLYKEFKKRGIETKIIVPRRGKSEDYGKDVILLGTSFPVNLTGSRADFCVNFNHLSVKKVLDREKFDVLHFHNCGIPSTVQILMHSKALNVLTLHANMKDSDLLKKFPAVLKIFEKIVQWKADGLIAVASFNLDPFKNYRGPKAVIPNGIDLQEFNPKIPKIRKFRDGKTNILFVGRIEERKGLIYLLKAYKILSEKNPNLRLIVVGDGELKKNCLAWAKKNKLQEVCFEGEKTGKELPLYFATADIFVSPAIFGESFGIVLLEAMASAKPVVAFANKGYKGFLGDKKGGFLAKPRDWRDLAEKIGLLAKDKKLRENMAEIARKEAKSYSWSKVAAKVLAFYNLCAKNAKRKKAAKQTFSTIDEILSSLYNADILAWFKRPK